MTWTLLLDRGTAGMLLLHALLLAAIGLKALDLWRPARFIAWGAPAYPEAFPGDPAAQERALLRLERGVWCFGLAASCYPFLGLGGTVLEVADALGRLGAGLRPEGLTVPLGQALRFTFHGIVGAVVALVAWQSFNRRLEVLARRGALAQRPHPDAGAPHA